MENIKEIRKIHDDITKNDLIIGTLLLMKKRVEAMDVNDNENIQNNEIEDIIFQTLALKNEETSDGGGVIKIIGGSDPNISNLELDNFITYEKTNIADYMKSLKSPYKSDNCNKKETE